jgi:hypothetical protein
LTKELFDQLMIMRESRLTNMFDVPVVVRVAREMDFDKLADWIDANR